MSKARRAAPPDEKKTNRVVFAASEPKVGFADPLVLEQLRAGAVEDDAARLQDEPTVSDPRKMGPEKRGNRAAAVKSNRRPPLTS